MRRLILIAGVAIGLAACGKGGQEAADQNAGETLTAESIVSNDVTAIDAVTGDAANMAADVDMNYGNLDMNSTAPVTNGPAKAARPGAGKQEPAVENTAVAANTATNAE